MCLFNVVTKFDITNIFVLGFIHIMKCTAD